jgi:hypothetical protein
LYLTVRKITQPLSAAAQAKSTKERIGTARDSMTPRISIRHPAANGLLQNTPMRHLLPFPFSVNNYIARRYICQYFEYRGVFCVNLKKMT